MLNEKSSLESAIQQAEEKMQLRSFIEAINCWRHIIETYDQFPIGVRVRLASAYLDSGYADKASAEVEYCLQLAPDFDKALELQRRINIKKRLSHEIILTEANETKVTLYIESKLRPIPYEAIAAFSLRGWVSIKEGETAYLLLEITKKSITRLAFNEVRHDVVAALSGNDYSRHLPLCGFNYTVNISDIANIGVEIDGQAHWVCQPRLDEMLQILRGNDNWLFLENDTNRSVDQYTGRFLLDEQALTKYETFVNGLKELQQTQPMCYLVSPNKESVFPAHYPYARGGVTILDQVMATCGLGNEEYFIYPKDELFKAQNSYCRTDTHWTYGGAYTAFARCLSKFDVSVNHKNLFKFKTTLFEGDLGSKLEKLEYDTYTVATPAGKAPEIIFKSGTPRNHGRIIIYGNSDAPVKGTLAIFGSSFSYYFLEMFATVFSRVFFMYSPASPVMEILDEEKPDFVILETPERFLVHPPRIIENLSASPLSDIIESLTPFERDQIRSGIESEKEKDNIAYRFMKEKLSTLASA
ncbi:hypothetical protein [Azohydromonas lata]|uniref:AlgX/AlgJ SGNH hydrolase-like domain-containing protein n=1 Tax=Azohydromonas lata TaxID=45677 RepID=A0ABU5IN55_9BURK|nr:hypothetical protein [Azohydromonas lata]MDZ5460324.1 hypothetical protein [Azohydromonas lata]